MRSYTTLGLAVLLTATAAAAVEPSTSPSNQSSTPSSTTQSNPSSATAQGSASSTTHHLRKIKGSVVSVDATGRVVVVHPASGPDITLNVGDDTRYYLGKKPGAFTDLQVGSEISLDYWTENSVNNANKLWITVPKTTPPTPPPHSR